MIDKTRKCLFWGIENRIFTVAQHGFAVRKIWVVCVCSGPSLEVPVESLYAVDE